MGQHLSDAPSDIATLTFDLAGDGPSRRYGSSSSICTPSLKFVGLSVREIWRTSGLNNMSAWWPWPLSLTLKLVRIIAYGIDNLFTNFGIPGTFRSRLIDQQLSDASRDLATLTFDLEGHGARCWCASSCSVCLPSLKFVGLPFRKILRISSLTISRPGDLDLWPWNFCALLPVRWTTFIPILVFLGRFILGLSANTCQTRHVTLRPWRWRSRRLSLMRVFVLRLCTKFELRRPSRSHILCEH